MDTKFSSYPILRASWLKNPPPSNPSHPIHPQLAPQLVSCHFSSSRRNSSRYFFFLFFFHYFFCVCPLKKNLFIFSFYCYKYSPLRSFMKKSKRWYSHLPLRVCVSVSTLGFKKAIVRFGSLNTHILSPPSHPLIVCACFRSFPSVCVLPVTCEKKKKKRESRKKEEEKFRKKEKIK